ncbi:MAG: Chemotaxis protein CheR [Bacteroidetes bacterium]|nr:Chemotaxis protein CheR [Bacteroidota bacterium]
MLPDEAKEPVRKKDNLSVSLVEELEKELMYTKQQLHNTIEQMETSVEELKSTNEELQSTNEELQSTNEESLTTKEEMQSLNEELMTINMQYQSKAEELTQLNNDMKNLLDSTQIATIFLDNDLNIQRFTPQVTKLFNVIHTDVGRHITHVVSNFENTSLKDDIHEVLDKLKSKEMDVRTKSGEWYNLRIVPYRTLDNFIRGAILTFNQVTALKEIESKYKLTLHSWKILMNSISAPCAIISENKNLLAVNNKFANIFDISTGEADSKIITQLLNKNARPQIDKLFKELTVKKADKGEATITLGGKKYGLYAEIIKSETNNTFILFLKIKGLLREKRKK